MCANNLREAFQHIFNLSVRLQRQRVCWWWCEKHLAWPQWPRMGTPGFWMTAGQIPCEGPFGFSPVHTSGPQWEGWHCHPAAILCILPLGESLWKIMFIDFSSGFNTIQDPLLGEIRWAMYVKAPVVTWITAYLTGMPLFLTQLSMLDQQVETHWLLRVCTILLALSLYVTDFRGHSEPSYL